MKSNSKEKQSSELELGQIRPGDYMIHVFVETSKCFVLEGSEKSEFDALLEISCGSNTKQYSKTHKNYPV